MTRDVLAALGPGLDDRACENKLVMLLGFDHFELVRTLMRSRARVFFVTRFRQAQNESDLHAVEAEMRADPTGRGAAILLELGRRVTAIASATGAEERKGGEATSTVASLPTRAEAAASAVATAVAAATVATQRLQARIGAGGLLPGDLEDTVAPAAAAVGAAAAATLEPRTEAVDLSRLGFAEGSRLQSNNRCELPKGTWRMQAKGYESVTVPATRSVGAVEGERLVQVDELPPWARPAFEAGGVTQLNRIQSRVANAAMQTSENLLICAPTGAGKTNVALLCMLGLIGQHCAPRESGGFDFDTDSFKIVYIAPMKALVQECVRTFSKRLKAYGMTVRELSGDQSLTRAELEETNVIVTTPEKWDVITRKAAGGDRAYTQLVKLIIIDEIHLLHDDRGPVLEAIVARSIRQVESTQEMVRLVALSATLPNFEDVATFLRVDPRCGLFFFDASYRPVPLQQQYIGVTERKPLRRLQLTNELCFDKAQKSVALGNQVLVFVHSRADTAKTARVLRELALEKNLAHLFVREGSDLQSMLTERAERAEHPELKALLPAGFAIHHAGMSRGDRTMVEELFAQNLVRVLVSTATLAWGVNLPAHTVIIKGTQLYNPEKGGWCELSPLDVMQMMGRAGRYPLDSEGEGIIITAHSELQYYLSLLNQQLPIESQLVRRLPDLLNAEVALGSVQTVRDAAAWLSYSYLFVRMRRNPDLYDVPDADREDPLLEQRRLDLAHAAAVVLDRSKLIRYDRRSGLLQLTSLGRVAANFYLTHETVAKFHELMRPHMGDVDLFRLICLSGEFKNVRVRDEERAELEKLAQAVPIPLKEDSVDAPSAKVNVLLQAYIGRVRLDGLALLADMVYVHQSAGRITRAVFEMALKRGWAQLAERALRLSIMVERRIWLSQTPLRQFATMPEVLALKMESVAQMSWQRQLLLSHGDLGALVGRSEAGMALHRLAHMVPKVELKVAVMPLTRSLLRFDLTITPDFNFDRAMHGTAVQFWIFVEDVDGELLLHHELFSLGASSMAPRTLSIMVPVLDPLPPAYFVKVVADRWLHSEASLPVAFSHLLLPARFSPPTPLLDISPLPVAALREFHPVLEALFSGGDSLRGKSLAGAPWWVGTPQLQLNSVQTQVFPDLYERDGNVLVCAPEGSGLLACAELAIARQWFPPPLSKTGLLEAASGVGAAQRLTREYERMAELQCARLIVVLAPNEPAARRLHAMWRERFGSGRLHAQLRKQVVLLSGDRAADLRALVSPVPADLAVCSVRVWELLSRSWQTAPALQRTGLLVVTETHVLGSSDGPALEAAVSRMQLLSQQQRHANSLPIRIVALGGCMADAKDVAHWIGAGASCFNFALSARPLPLDLQLVGLDVAHFGSRLLAMARPAFTALLAGGVGRGPLDAEHAAASFVESGVADAEAVRVRGIADGGRCALVFTPSRRQCQLTAIDLVTFAATLAGDESRFLGPLGVPEAVVTALRDATLRETVRRGVGMLHPGLVLADQEAVEALFEQGALRVLVCAPLMGATSGALPGSTPLWSLRTGAHMVLVLGTETLDMHGDRFEDAPLPDLLRAVGLAGQPPSLFELQRPVLAALQRRRRMAAGDTSMASAAAIAAAAAGVESRAIVFLHTPKRERLRRMLLEPLPVESHLERTLLLDFFNAEVASKAVASMQDAVDLVTWTFWYRRIRQNPNYYGLSGVSDEHVRNFLSEVVERSMTELAESGCLQLDDSGLNVSPLNLGRIAAHFGVQHATVTMFAQSVTATTRHRGLLELLCASGELQDLSAFAPVRGADELAVLQRLGSHLPLPVPHDVEWVDPALKANVLLQAHLSRLALSPEMRADQQQLLVHVFPLLQALTNVVSSARLLGPALAAVGLSQMLLQAIWLRGSLPRGGGSSSSAGDSLLLQLPHFVAEAADKCRQFDPPVHDVFELIEMEEGPREALLRHELRFSEAQVSDVALFCNSYPSVAVSTSPGPSRNGVVRLEATAPGETVAMTLRLRRDDGEEESEEAAGGGSRDDDDDDDGTVGEVLAPRCPRTRRREVWWVLAALQSTSPSTPASLIGLRSVALGSTSETLRLALAAPREPGTHAVTLYVMCDAYAGCDQELPVELIVPGVVPDSDEQQQPSRRARRGEA